MSESDRDIVLSLGAKFTKKDNAFYVPENELISKFNKYIPLTIELIPHSNWNKNVRSEFKKDWDWIKRLSYKNAGYRCEICGNIGESHPVECHEIWDFNPETQIQKLMGLISLCPTCHKIKHSGLAITNGEESLVISHLNKINKWKDEDSYKYLNEAFQIYEILSRFDWQLDLSYLDKIIKNKQLKKK